MSKGAKKLKKILEEHFEFWDDLVEKEKIEPKSKMAKHVVAEAFEDVDSYSEASRLIEQGGVKKQKPIRESSEFLILTREGEYLKPNYVNAFSLLQALKDERGNEFIKEKIQCDESLKESPINVALKRIIWYQKQKLSTINNG